MKPILAAMLLTTSLITEIAVAQTSCSCAIFTIDQQQRFEEANLRQKVDSAFQVIETIKKDQDLCCQAIARTLEAILLNTVGKSTGSFDSAKLAIKILGNNRNDYVELEGYRLMGIGYNRMGNPDSSLYCYLRALELAERLKKEKFLPKLFANISTVYINQKQITKGLHYQKKSLRAATIVNDSMAMAQAYANIVTTYGELLEQTKKTQYLDSAKTTAKTSLQLAKYSALPLLLIRNYLSMTKFALAENKFALAKNYSDTVFQYLSEKINPLVFYSAFIDRGECFLRLGQPGDAVKALEKAYGFVQNTANAYTKKLIYQKLWEAHKANGNQAKALAFLEGYKELSDSLVNIDNARIIDEMEQKYNQAKNERTIKELAQEKQIYLLVAVAGLLGIAAIAFFLRQQSLRHRKNILETEQRLNRARMNPHFFFNALSALQKFAMAGADGTVMASNLSKFSHIMRETLESTYKEYVTIEQEMEFLSEYLEVQRLRFPNAFAFEIAADTNLDISDLLIPSMIIQPFVENTIEHGFSGIPYPGLVRIYFSGTEKEVQIEIKDNGKGLPTKTRETNEHISRASQIIKDRIYLLNIKLKSKAGFSIDNIDSGGVVVKINLPAINKN